MSTYLPVEILVNIFSFCESYILSLRSINKDTYKYVDEYLLDKITRIYNGSNHSKKYTNISVSYKKISDNKLKRLLSRTKYNNSSDSKTQKNRLKKKKINYFFEKSNITPAYFPKIRKLNISKCHSITNDALRYLDGIEELDISYCNISNAGLKYLTNVKSLILCYCTGLSDSGMRHLSKVINLDIRNTYISDKGLKYLTNIERLKLHHYSTHITDNGLKNIPNVKELYAANCSITNVGLGYLKKIEILDISGCSEITIEGLKNIPTVKELNIVDCCFRLIRTEIIEHLPNLQKVILNVHHESSVISKKGYSYLLLPHRTIAKQIKHIYNKQKYNSKYLFKISHLIIDGTYNNAKSNSEDDESLHCVSGIDTVEIMYLNITDRGLENIKDVKKLSISFCKNITYSGISKISTVDNVIFKPYF